MNISTLFEQIFFGAPIQPGPGLPPPPEKKVGRPVASAKPGARLVNQVTMTYEWDISRAHVATAAPADLTDMEQAELAKRGQKNQGWNIALKLARVQGATASEAAKAAGCSLSYAAKVFAALSKFDGR